jgi:uncharacterized protein
MLKSLLASALLFTAATFNPAFAEDIKLIRSISLNGHGEVRVAPDLAIVTMGVMSSAVTAQEALAANTKAMTELMAALKAANIEPKDIQTSNFSVNPRYDYGQNNGQPAKLTGYDVANNVTVTLRKIDSMGDLLDKAVSAGSNQINGVSFSVANPQDAMDEARKDAVKDAKRKADLYAAATSTTIGNLISLSEGVSTEPQPMMMRGKMMAASSDSSPVPIAQGEQVISVDVNVAWEIR